MENKVKDNKRLRKDKNKKKTKSIWNRKKNIESWRLKPPNRRRKLCNSRFGMSSTEATTSFEFEWVLW